MVTLDFKQNIANGNQQREIGTTWRGETALTIFGTHLCTDAKRTHVDYASDQKNHAAHFVKQCLKNMVDQDWFKNLCETAEIKTVNFWTDNVGHLHNQMHFFWCLAELRIDEKCRTLEIESTKCFFFCIKPW